MCSRRGRGRDSLNCLSNRRPAELKRDARVDSTRIATIGYCFGGMVVLSQARAGADLAAVVSFHGALPSGKVDSGSVKARVLVLTGAADPMVPPAEVTRFSNEMTAAGARFQVASYPGVKHSFTNPEAGSHGMDALGYDAEADRQSWAAMVAMFREVFGAELGERPDRSNLSPTGELMSSEPYSVEAHLRVAVYNALVVVLVAFVVGSLTGWALSRWATTRVGAVVGAAIGCAFVAWLCRMYYATRGLLHHTGLSRPRP